MTNYTFGYVISVTKLFKYFNVGFFLDQFELFKNTYMLLEAKSVDKN